MVVQVLRSEYTLANKNKQTHNNLLRYCVVCVSVFV